MPRKINPLQPAENSSVNEQVTSINEENNTSTEDQIRAAIEYMRAAEAEAALFLEKERDTEKSQPINETQIRKQVQQKSSTKENKNKKQRVSIDELTQHHIQGTAVKEREVYEIMKEEKKQYHVPKHVPNYLSDAYSEIFAAKDEEVLKILKKDKETKDKETKEKESKLKKLFSSDPKNTLKQGPNNKDPDTGGSSRRKRKY